MCLQTDGSFLPFTEPESYWIRTHPDVLTWSSANVLFPNKVSFRHWKSGLQHLFEHNSTIYIWKILFICTSKLQQVLVKLALRRWHDIFYNTAVIFSLNKRRKHLTLFCCISYFILDLEHAEFVWVNPHVLTNWQLHANYFAVHFGWYEDV